MRYLFALLAATLLAGCASVPLASSHEDIEAKRFNSEKTQASIYIYRDEGFIGSARTLPILIGGRTIGATAPKTFFLISVAPGKHKLASTEGKFFSLDLEAEAGGIYFVRHIPHVEMWGISGSLELVSEQVGRKGVLLCKRSPNLF